ncbi:hypothetical protein PF011_g9908 [Phytophthora fragariae]|uniref:Uncharacterized protein n=1 Tax=Phytophthora fragariae TaxID=53985 RepID=A0A6A3KSC2_9STRA|nr:hypothetical protein PF011_g9908 [Phytophthora fragariae]
MQHQPGPPPGSEEAPPPPDEGPPPNEEPPPSWDLLSLAQPREDTPEREACDDKERQRHTGQGKQQRDKQEWPSKGSKGIAATQDSIVAETQPSQDPEQEGMTDVAEGDPAATPGRGQQATTEDPRSSGQTRPTDERGSTGEERHRDEPPVSDPQQPVTPEEMFNALVEDMRASPAIGQVEAWRATMRELFAKVYLAAVPVQRAVVPAERQRFPKLTGAEVSALLTLFEQTYVADAGTYADWNKLATAISHELLSTKWAFNEIVRKLSSRLKWAKAPVLNQWVQTVTQEAQPRREQGPTPPPPVFEAFMFDPDTYSAAEAKKLRTICVKPKDRTRGTRLREGTDAEWKIIGGMTDGSIACRKLPVFIKQVLDAQERLRLHSTIQAQVEGELVLHLIRNRGVRVSQQTTKAITDAILESAELARVNLTDVHRMLSQTKTISNDRVTKSIHFYFFTRETAVKHKNVRVPFKGTVYTLQNAHRPVAGTVWQRQQGPDGVYAPPRAEYVIHLYNITRFNKIGRIAAYLKAKI